MNDKFGNEVQKITQDIITAGQKGDMKKVAELGKQIYEPICCGIWQSKACMIGVFKVNLIK